MNRMSSFSKSVLASLAALTIGTLLPSATAALTFAPSAGYAVGERPEGVTAGDFNNDGLTDIATTTDTPDKVEILLGDGMGGFVAGPVVFLPASSSPGELVAGDLDGDTDTDLAVALKDFSTVIVLVNSGGVFTAAGQYATGEEPRGMSIADMDADTDLDVAVANRDSNTVTILENDGFGGFASTSYAVGEEPRDAAFGDFGGDGAIDVAVTNHRDRNISILINSGGVFASSMTLSVGGQVRPEGVTAADLDGDGDTDIAAATNGQDDTINTASVFINQGGTFAGPFAYPTTGVAPSRIVAADFDCDGLADLATVNTITGNVSILPNLGGGVFGAATLVGVGVNPETIVAAEFDDQGGPDLATADRDSNRVSVILNMSCAADIVGDVDGDGDVDLSDLAALLAAYGTCEGDPDYNPDADFVIDEPVSCITLSDLAALLANYGT
jgi:hypothetical protein